MHMHIQIYPSTIISPRKARGIHVLIKHRPISEMQSPRVNPAERQGMLEALSKEKPRQQNNSFPPPFLMAAIFLK